MPPCNKEKQFFPPNYFLGFIVCAWTVKNSQCALCRLVNYPLCTLTILCARSAYLLGLLKCYFKCHIHDLFIAQACAFPFLRICIFIPCTFNAIQTDRKVANLLFSTMKSMLLDCLTKTDLI